MKPKPIGQMTINGRKIVFMATPDRVKPGEFLMSPDPRGSYGNYYDLFIRPRRASKRHYMQKLINRRILSFK